MPPFVKLARYGIFTLAGLIAFVLSILVFHAQFATVGPKAVSDIEVVRPPLWLAFTVLFLAEYVNGLVLLGSFTLVGPGSRARLIGSAGVFAAWLPTALGIFLIMDFAIRVLYREPTWQFFDGPFGIAVLTFTVGIVRLWLLERSVGMLIGSKVSLELRRRISYALSYFAIGTLFFWILTTFPGDNGFVGYWFQLGYFHKFIALESICCALLIAHWSLYSLEDQARPVELAAE